MSTGGSVPAGTPVGREPRPHSPAPCQNVPHQADKSRQGCAHRGGEVLPKVEGLPCDRYREGLGRPPVEDLCQGDERLRRQVMAQGGLKRFSRIDPSPPEGGRFSFSRSIYENNLPCPAKRLSELGRQLVERKDFKPGVTDLFRQSPGRMPPQSVIGTRGIAVPDDYGLR